MKLSIAIPTYEMHGKGKEFLEFNFQKLLEQTFHDFEIIISDHSKDNEIKNLCDLWSTKLKIKYLKNEEKIGNSSSNINNAVRHCNGDWIKILFQDDFLFNSNSLENTTNEIKKQLTGDWLISACEHSPDGHQMTRKFFPKYHDQIHLGNNTISSPSVLTIRNNPNLIFFDENLVWLMDVEYYKRLHQKFGDPIILNEITVVNRTSSFQLSNFISEETKRKELLYVMSKFQTFSNKIF